MKFQCSPKGMIMDISSMRSFAAQLLGKGKKYDRLLSCLLEKDYYNDDELPFPSVKYLKTYLGLNEYQVRKQLELIYHDLIYTERKRHIVETEYVFYLSYFENRHSLMMKSLPVIPRIGEQVKIPFFNSCMGTSVYYVEDIRYKFEDTKMSVYFSLSGGFYNLYWHWRKDEAKLKKELDLMDFYKLDDYDLMKKLRIN